MTEKDLLDSLIDQEDESNDTPMDDPDWWALTLPDNILADLPLGDVPLIPLPVEPSTQMSSMVRITAHRRFDRYFWTEKSNVEFDRRYRIGKSRKFVLRSSEPLRGGLVRVHLEDPTGTNSSEMHFYISKTEDKDDQCQSLELPWIGRGGEVYFFLFLKGEVRKRDARPHSLHFDFIGPDRIRRHYTLGNLFGAEHKHESSKKMKEKHDTSNTAIYLDLLDHSSNGLIAPVDS